MATKTVKKKSDQSTVDMLKTKAADLHKAALKASNELVEESIATGEQWQNIMAKSLKKGTVLFGKQQDMLLSGLEMVKEQFAYGNKRFQKLVTFEPVDTSKKKAAAKKAAVKGKSAKRRAEVKASAVKSEKAAKPAAAKKSRPVKASRDIKPAVKAKAVPSKKVNLSNLTVIEGIGPKIDELLKKAGMTDLDKLAAANPADLKKILTDAGTRFQMHDPSTWPAQAKLAAAGKTEELKVLQEELKGGK